jgi:hypothetical protein
MRRERALRQQSVNLALQTELLRASGLHLALQRL